MHYPNQVRIYMDKLTIELGMECSTCLRWFVPFVDESEPCPHCEQHGIPKFPNRVRYLAVKKGISLLQLAKDANICWASLSAMYQGRKRSFIGTKKKVLKALGESTKNSNVQYVFPGTFK